MTENNSSPFSAYAKNNTSHVNPPVIWFKNGKGMSTVLPKHALYPVIVTERGDNRQLVTVSGLGVLISLTGQNMEPLLNEIFQGRVHCVSAGQTYTNQDDSVSIVEKIKFRTAFDGQIEND